MTERRVLLAWAALLALVVVTPSCSRSALDAAKLCVACRVDADCGTGLKCLENLCRKSCFTQPCCGDCRKRGAEQCDYGPGSDDALGCPNGCWPWTDSQRRCKCR